MSETTFQPFVTPSGEHLITMGGREGYHVTDTVYHQQRERILLLRKEDPSAGALLDKYATQRANGRNINFASADADKLEKAMTKYGVTPAAGVAVANDLSQHGYNLSYRPAVAVNVDGQPWDPKTVTEELKRRNIPITGTPALSEGPKRLSAGALKVNTEALARNLVDNFDRLSSLLTPKGVVAFGTGMGNVASSMLSHLTHQASLITKILPGIGKSASAVAIMSAFSEVASASTPADRRLAGGKLLQEFASLADPSGVVLPTIVHSSLDLPGKSPLAELSSDKRRDDAGTINTWNLRIIREQNFIMSPDHPGQLAALRINDKGGKSLDIAESLRDPSKRDFVLLEIDRLATAAGGSDKGEVYKQMKVAAQDFIRLNDSIRALPDATASQKVSKDIGMNIGT